MMPFRREVAAYLTLAIFSYLIPAAFTSFVHWDLQYFNPANWYTVGRIALAVIQLAAFIRFVSVLTTCIETTK